jgi:hypothetical protein
MLPLISAELILIRWISGLRALGFSGLPLGGNAFTTQQVGQLPAFRADVHGVPIQRWHPLPADLNAQGCQVANGVLHPHLAVACHVVAAGPNPRHSLVQGFLALLCYSTLTQTLTAHMTDLLQNPA